LAIARAAHLIQSKIRTMPGQEQDGGMGAVASKAAVALPVRVAAHAVPRLVRHAMDTGDLVVGRQALLILALQALQAQDEEVELVGMVLLEIPELAAEGHGSCPGQGRVSNQRARVVTSNPLRMPGATCGRGEAYRPSQEWWEFR
jgi:hypothetical protein